MKIKSATAAGMFLALTAAAGSAAAGSFDENMAKCLDKFANAHDTAVVLLECTVAGVKASNCKVLEIDQANKGFDKAAVCVAEALPLGARTGQIKIPVRFPGGA
jgi:hypothetical protein